MDLFCWEHLQETCCLYFFTLKYRGSGSYSQSNSGMGISWECGTINPYESRNTITIWLFNIAMENGPFIDGLPIKNGDFPWLC